MPSDFVEKMSNSRTKWELAFQCGWRKKGADRFGFLTTIFVYSVADNISSVCVGLKCQPSIYPAPSSPFVSIRRRTLTERAGFGQYKKNLLNRSAADVMNACRFFLSPHLWAAHRSCAAGFVNVNLFDCFLFLQTELVIGRKEC
jgi:hypothetical protein